MLYQVKAPCGAGKSSVATRLALISAKAEGSTVLYVVPTIALIREFLSRAEKHNATDVVQIRIGMSSACRYKPNLIAISNEKFTHTWCQVCPYNHECDYIRSSMIDAPQKGKVIVTTQASVIWNVRAHLDNGGIHPEYDLIIYDEQPPFLQQKPKKGFSRLKPIAIAAGKGYYVPLLPRGTKGTYVLSATPQNHLLAVNFQIPESYIQTISLNEFQKHSNIKMPTNKKYPLLSLDQELVVRWEHLPMRGGWKATSLSTKSRTPKGLPYFGGSIGQNPWRGQSGTTVEGSYRYPPSVLDTMSHLLTEIVGTTYYSALIPIEVNFDNNASLLSAGFGVRNGKPILDLVEPSWVDIVQLAGRMGVDVQVGYTGDVAFHDIAVLNDSGNVEYRMKRVRKSFLKSASPYAIAVSSARFAMATDTDIREVVSENYRRLAKALPLLDESLILSVAREYIRSMNYYNGRNAYDSRKM